MVTTVLGQLVHAHELWDKPSHSHSDLNCNSLIYKDKIHTTFGPQAALPRQELAAPRQL